MPEIWIRSTHQIVGALRTEPNDGPFVFRFSTADLTECEVTIDASGEQITSKARIVISNGLLKELENKTQLIDLPQSLEDEIIQKKSYLITASERVLRLLQQELRDPTLLPTNELAEGRSQWSYDGETWQPISRKVYATISAYQLGTLDKRWQKIVQKWLEDGEEPLLAMQHLYEAHKSDGLRFKWVEATIAAELAIKEMLIRMEPKLETLLTEVPSPPLKKLYGSVLEAVTGEKSPHRNELDKGAERRNKIVHQPKAEHLDTQEVFDYVSMVGEAISHLVELHRSRREKHK